MFAISIRTATANWYLIIIICISVSITPVTHIDQFELIYSNINVNIFYI